jgi:NAD(P)-dependent dehydrogenase (short-subunit alcohol dehydrogenase family)
MPKLKDRVALVTGGGRGLGAAICERLAESGVQVAVTDRDGLSAGEVASRIRARGQRAIAVEADVSDAQQADQAMQKVLRELGGLDILINNAGVDVTLSVEDLPITEWDRIIATNLKAPFVLSKIAMATMRPGKRGHIVNIVSTAAKRAWANASAYHASKWGLLGFTHALHVEARPHGIKVTAVLCGGMRTPFLTERFPDIDLSTLQDPADVAETIHHVLLAPEGTVIPEIMALPMRETSWP